MLAAAGECVGALACAYTVVKRSPGGKFADAWMILRKWRLRFMNEPNSVYYFKLERIKR